MIRWGKELRPYKTLIVKGGEATIFDVPVAHWTGKYKKLDGFISIVANGSYKWEKGDLIKIKQRDVRGVERREWNSYVTVSIYVNAVELIKAKDRVAEENKDTLDDNIPEELWG